MKRTNNTKKDMVGFKVGKLTVLSEDFEREKEREIQGLKKNTYWLCKCGCGNIVSIQAQSLRRKNNPTKSCGCARIEHNKSNKGKSCSSFIDITGEKFGRLTVIEKSDKTSGKRKKVMWNCICDCGTKVTILGESLKSGITTSCGCYYDETRGIESKKENIYDLESFDYGVGICSNGDVFYFDKEDYDKIKDFCWTYDGRYVQAHNFGKYEKIYTTRLIRLHRLVLDIKDREEINVDHKNLVRNDCRKSNLRMTTDEENSRNRKETRCTKQNLVGIKQKNNKFIVSILGKRVDSCTTLKEAIELRCKKEKEIFGEFRYNPNLEKVQ